MIFKMQIDINDRESLTNQEFSYLKFNKAKGSQISKDKALSLRASARLMWGIRLYAWSINQPKATVSTILEQSFWQGVSNANLILRSQDRTHGSYEKGNDLLRFWLNSWSPLYDEKGNQMKDEKGTKLYEKNYEFTSVIELTWSFFYLFRLIRLNIIEPKYLRSSEESLIEFILNEDFFWIDKEKDNGRFEEGLLRPMTLLRCFEEIEPKDFRTSDGASIKLDDEIKSSESKLEKKLNENPNLSASDIQMLYQSNIDNLKQDESSLAEEEEQVTKILSSGSIDQEFFYAFERGPKKENHYFLPETIHFPLEIRTLHKLKNKMCDIKISKL